MTKLIAGIMIAAFAAGAYPSLAAAAEGYEACREKGRSHSDCLTAGSGYGACRDKGRSHTDCLTAGSGYGACRDKGRSHSDCLTAASGYEACRDKGRSHSDCLTAASGYEACRDKGRSHTDCLTAGSGYGACRDKGRSHTDCLGVIGGEDTPKDKTPPAAATKESSKAAPAAAITATSAAANTTWDKDCYKQALSRGLSSDAAIKQCTGAWNAKNDTAAAGKDAVNLSTGGAVTQLKSGDPSISPTAYVPPEIPSEQDKTGEKSAADKKPGFWEKLWSLLFN